MLTHMPPFVDARFVCFAQVDDLFVKLPCMLPLVDTCLLRGMIISQCFLVLASLHASPDSCVLGVAAPLSPPS